MKRRTDRYLISFLIFLLFAECLWLLEHQGSLQFRNSFQSSNKIAGKIIDTKENVKKRHQGSFVWQETKSPDQINFYDSILTQSQSSAEILLTDNTKISLGEGTLITIEPPDSRHQNKIVLNIYTAQRKKDFLKSTKPEEVPVSQLALDEDTEISFQLSSENELVAKVTRGDANPIITQEAQEGNSRTPAREKDADDFKIKLVKELPKKKVKSQPVQEPRDLPPVQLPEPVVVAPQKVAPFVETIPTEPIAIQEVAPAPTPQFKNQKEEEQLSAPRLKKPKIREPSSKKKNKNKSQILPIKSSLLGFVFSLLINEAHAQTPTPVATTKPAEIDLEWEKIKKAKSYWIEISKDPGFTNKLVRANIQTPNYHWETLDRGTFYWRVQAESKTGKLGMMSDADSFHLTEKNEKKAPVQVAAAAPIVPRKESMRLYFNPVYRIQKQDGTQGSNATVQGGSIMSFAFAKEWLGQNGTFDFYAQFTSFEWKPKSKTEFPFQDKQRVDELTAHFLYNEKISDWSFGATTETMTKVERVGREKIALTAQQALGLSTKYNFSPNAFSQFSILAANNSYRGKLHLQFTNNYSRIVYGAYLSATTDSIEEKSGSQLTIGILTGFDFAD